MGLSPGGCFGFVCAFLFSLPSCHQYVRQHIIASQSEREATGCSFQQKEKVRFILCSRILFVPGIHLSNYMKGVKTKPDSVPITIIPIFLDLGGSGGDDLLAVLVVADTGRRSPVTAALARSDTI